MIMDALEGLALAAFCICVCLYAWIASGGMG